MRYAGGELCLAALVLVAMGTTPALSLTDEEIFREFRFNFINPGARSLALGGAFISVADDATSAQANPAGLSILLRTEYFIEVRGVDNGGDTTVLQFPTPGGAPNAFGSGTNLSDFGSITFAGVVVPVNRWSFGASRQEVLNTDSDTINQFGVFSSPTDFFLASGSGFIDAHLVNYNVSAGVRISDRWSLGASVSLDTLSVDSEVSNYVVDPNGLVAPSPIPQSTLDIRTRISDSDSAFGYTLGTIFKPVDSVSLGAVYRHAPVLSVSEQIDGAGLDVFGVRALLGRDFSNVFNIPDSYGIGASWRPTQSLTLALDVERVRYSDLLDGYVPGINVLTGPDARFTVDDATNVRLGGEWVLLTQSGFPLAFRGGVYYQPDSTIHALSVGKNTGAQISFATEEAFPPGSDEVHGAAGLGLVTGRVKLDMGMDIGPDSNEFLISFIFQGD